jgi:hypothetical protein
LAFVKDYSAICLIPNLHLNQVTLIGQDQIDNYIAVRQKQDAFYALSNHVPKGGADGGEAYTLLTTWDVLTGKRTAMEKFYGSGPNSAMNTIGYERFTTVDDGEIIDVYKAGAHDWTLLRKREKETEYAHLIEQNFDPAMLSKKFDRQIVYHKSKNDKKDFYKFKLIRLQDHQSVETVLRFEH